MATSLVCQKARDRPNRDHVPCTGCDCTCHHVKPPADFRRLVEAARTEKRDA